MVKSSKDGRSSPVYLSPHCYIFRVHCLGKHADGERKVRDLVVYNIRSVHACYTYSDELCSSLPKMFRLSLISFAKMNKVHRKNIGVV
jgi:hypothetical protein